jgi:hypothetical protein
MLRVGIPKRSTAAGTMFRAVGQWLPDYEARKARLRELGTSLMW